MSELRTPLEIAVIEGNLGGISTRLNHGDTPHDLNHLGIPVLYDGLQGNNLDVLDRLNQAGADWSTPYNHGGFTPLIYASLHSDLNTVRWLIDKGQDIGQSTQQGVRAMHVAVQRESTAIAEFLYQTGADPFQETHHGETPLLISLKAKRSLAMFRFLLSCYDERGEPVEPKLLPCLARIFDRQQADAVDSVKTLLSYTKDVPSEQTLREFMAMPGNYSASPFRTLERTLSTDLSGALFALLRAERIARGIRTSEPSSQTWQGFEGL